MPVPPVLNVSRSAVAWPDGENVPPAMSALASDTVALTRTVVPLPSEIATDGDSVVAGPPSV